MHLCREVLPGACGPSGFTRNECKKRNLVGQASMTGITAWAKGKTCTKTRYEPRRYKMQIRLQCAVQISYLTPKAQRHPALLYSKRIHISTRKDEDGSTSYTAQDKTILEVQDSRFKQPLLNPTILKLPPSTAKLPTLINGIQRQPPRAHLRGGNAS